MRPIIFMVLFLIVGECFAAEKYPESFRKEVMSGCVSNFSSEVCSCVLDMSETIMTVTELRLVASGDRSVSPSLKADFVAVADICASMDTSRKYPKIISEAFYTVCKTEYKRSAKYCRCVLEAAQRYLYVDEWVSMFYDNPSRKVLIVNSYILSKCEGK